MTDARTFDLVAALAGRTYPGEVVPIFFDESLQYELAKLDRLIVSTDNTETLAELKKTRDELLEKFKAATYKVTLEGVPQDVVEATLKQVTDEYPQEYDAFGRAKPNPEGDKKFTVKEWELHIRSLEDPNGGVIAPVTEEHILLLMNKAPRAAQAAISRAITRLRDDSVKGYEDAIQGLDFLS